MQSIDRVREKILLTNRTCESLAANGLRLKPERSAVEELGKLEASLNFQV